LRSAPVKAPFSKPKSSDSISVSGSAAALSGTKALAAARPMRVDGAGNKLLAAAGLAEDQHRHGAAGDGADLLEKAPASAATRRPYWPTAMSRWERTPDPFFARRGIPSGGR